MDYSNFLFNISDWHRICDKPLGQVTLLLTSNLQIDLQPKTLISPFLLKPKEMSKNSNRKIQEKEKEKVVFVSGMEWRSCSIQFDTSLWFILYTLHQNCLRDTKINQITVTSLWVVWLLRGGCLFAFGSADKIRKKEKLDCVHNALSKVRVSNCRKSRANISKTKNNGSERDLRNNIIIIKNLIDVVDA